MNQILHILKYKMLIFVRYNSKIDFSSLVKTFGGSIIYFAFAVGAFLFSKKFIWFLISEIKIGLFLLHEFISIILFIFFISVNIGNIIVSYSTLFKSSEVGFLFTKPINPQKIFLLKFLDNFFYSSSTLFLILLSVLAGYASYFEINIFSLFFLVIFNFIPFILTAGSLGVIILMLLIKLASVYNLKKVIYGLVIIYLLMILSFFNVQSPVELARNVFELSPIADKDQFLGQLLSPFLNFLPNSWLSYAAFFTIKNNFQQAIPFYLFQISTMIVTFSLAIYLGNKWYFKAWLLNLKLTAEQISSRRVKKAWFSFGLPSYFKPKTEALLKKEFWTFFREPSQWLHLIVLLFLILIFISSVSGIRYVGLGNFYLQTGIYLSIFVFNLLLISTLSLRFVFPLISLEGSSFWKIKSSPIESKLFIEKKLFPWFVFILSISIGLSYFANYRFVAKMEWMAGIITTFSSITIIALNFGMGGLFANYKEKNPIRLASSQGASITFLINIIYMLFIVMILFKPISNYFLSIMLRQRIDLSHLLFSIIPIVLLSIVVISISIRIAAHSLKKDF